MANWTLEKKIAATLTLALLGLGYLAGLVNLALNVGLTPGEVKSRYMERPPVMDMDAMLDQEPPVSPEKLAHVAHAHMIPYTLVFALCAFFVIHFNWASWPKIGFLSSFALSIPMDFAGMALTRFISPGFYIVIMASGAIFGGCLAITILWSVKEIWLSSGNMR